MWALRPWLEKLVGKLWCLELPSRRFNSRLARWRHLTLTGNGTKPSSAGQMPNDIFAGELDL